MLLKGISQKNKFYLVILTSIVLVLLCFKLAIGKTIDEKKLHRSYSRQITLLNDAPLELKKLEDQLFKFEKYSSGELGRNHSLDLLILERATVLTKNMNVKITELPKNESFTQDGFTISTQALTLEGSFKDLLDFLNQISQEKSVGSICSVDFYNKKDFKRSAAALNMKIFFQTIFQNDKK